MGKERGMYHRGIIVAQHVVIVNGGDVGLLTWTCGSRPILLIL